jgi:hypothetical protein
MNLHVDSVDTGGDTFIEISESDDTGDESPRFSWAKELGLVAPSGLSIYTQTPSTVHLLSDEVPAHARGLCLLD